MDLVIAQRETSRPDVALWTVVLSGSMGPVGSLIFGGEQRSEIEWISGSKVARVRLDGPSENETDVTLRWRGRRFTPGEMLLNGAPVETLYEAQDVLDAMRQDPVLVDVTWDGRKRVGFLRAATFEVGLAQTIDVQLTFAWVTPADVVLADLPKPIRSPLEVSNQLQAEFDAAMEGVFEGNAWAWTRGGLEDIDTAISRVRENIYRVGVAAEGVRNIASDITGVRRQMAQGLAQLFLTTESVHESLFTTPTTLVQVSDAEQQIIAGDAIARMARANRIARHTAARERVAFQGVPELAYYHCVRGDTVFGLSSRWWGSSQYAQLIIDENNLFSSKLRPGQKIRIPRLPANA